jgi:hypothetical protein
VRPNRVLGVGVPQRMRQQGHLAVIERALTQIGIGKRSANNAKVNRYSGGPIAVGRPPANRRALNRPRARVRPSNVKCDGRP